MPVEIILKTKVEGLGAEADLVRVKTGYARNYLIPQDMAVPATAASKQQLEQLKRKRAEREANELNAAQELAGKLSKLKLSFTLAAVEGQEKVFGSVTSQDIADKVKEAGYEIDKRKIDLPKAIKESGSHEVSLHLAHGVNAKLKVEISHPSKPKTEEEGDAKTAKGSKGASAKKTKETKEKDAKEPKETKAKKSKSSKQE